LVGSVVS